MPGIVELLCSRRVPHVAALALISFGFAGCSADMSSRLSQDSLSNPFASQPEATGSVPAPAVERRELPQHARPQAALSPAVSAPKSYSVASAGVSGGGRGIASYAPPAQPQLETTASVPPRSVAATRAPSHGGTTTIIVGTSDTLEVLARRYNVTSAAILAANGYKGPRTLSPGQQLIIPHPGTATAAAPVTIAPASKPAAVVAAAPSIHVVNPGDTLAGIARHNHMSVAELARANNLDPSAKIRLGTKLTVPGARMAAAAPAGPAPTAIQPIAVTTAPATRMAAQTVPAQSARLAQATPTPDERPSRRRSSRAKPPARCRPSAGRCAVR
jgi:LysM repeat protein